VTKLVGCLRCYQFITNLDVLLSLTLSSANAQGFADDFSIDTASPGYRLFTNAVVNPDAAATADDSGLLLSIVHEDPDSGDRAVYEIEAIDAQNSISSTAEFLGDRPSSGTIRFETFSRFFNVIQDGGPNPDTREGDVEIEISLRLGPTPADDQIEACFLLRDADLNSQAVDETLGGCPQFQLAELALNTPYTIAVGVNRNTQELYAQLNEERITVASSFTFFEPAQPTVWSRFRVRDGAEQGEFRLSTVIVDGAALDIRSINEFSRYQQSDFDDFPDDANRSKEVVDGRLRLSTTVDSADEDGDAFLRFSEPNDYIEADMVYSSETAVTLSEDGFAAVRLSGLLYNDISADTSLGNTGSVWASVMLIDNAGSGLEGEYCVIRSDTDDFSSSTDLGDGLDDNRCPTFDLAVERDVVYNASMQLDQEAKTITFKLGEETKVYDIQSDIYKRDGTLRAQSRMARGATGTVVGYFDNLRNDPAALTDEEIAASMNVAVEGGDVATSSGGCSVGQGPREYSLLILLIAALLTIATKKITRRR